MLGNKTVDSESRYSGAGGKIVIGGVAERGRNGAVVVVVKDAELSFLAASFSPKPISGGATGVGRSMSGAASMSGGVSLAVSAEISVESGVDERRMTVDGVEGVEAATESGDAAAAAAADEDGEDDEAQLSKG